ncbi:MAG TPA: vanadium-dependent haloperoxidase, partial [Verrucomicrobiae bacterium]
MKFLRIVSLILAAATLVADATAAQSIARQWDERALAAIRQDTPHPPAQARNYFSLSVCMWDAWAAYDTNGAVGFIYRGKHTATNVAAARNEAISYAAWRLLKERHVYSRTAAATLAADDTLMTSLGYDTNNASLNTSTPAGVGNSVYAAVSAWFLDDGARQTNGIPYPLANPPVAYPDYPVGQGGYVYTNYPLATDRPGITDGYGHTVSNINHWQRLQIVNAVDQNGFPQGPIQPYLGAQWLGVRPFALTRTDPTKPWIDPGPPPFFEGATHAQFVKEVVAVITADSQLTPDDGVTIDISPRAYGSNSLDFAGAYGNGDFDIYDGHGYATNPVTGFPYASNVVKRGDFARVCAEFWADGPNSETPPGHWNVVANYVSDHPLLAKRIGGTGPVVDDLEWDVKMYFSLNAAVHEAACACWAAKRAYDGWRPMSAVRYLGGLGQSTAPGLPSYNSNGLPLITNIIELVTSSSVASGRHAGLTPDKIAVLAWPGPPADTNQHSGVKWIHADNWSTYQRTNFVTPAFPGYFSGHSTFSRSAAEVLAAITGSPYFPGGLGTFTNYVLGFENGPSVPITLQWATYYDAADQAGISRIWG